MRPIECSRLIVASNWTSDTDARVVTPYTFIVFTMSSRKRAPLIHRASNADSSLSWSYLYKGLADATDEHIITSLLFQVVDTLPSDFPATNLIKLVASKLPSVKFSVDLRDRITQLLARVSEPVPHAFILVRYLVKHERSRTLNWDRGSANLCLLLSLEMAAWDSLSDGHTNKRMVALELANHSSANEDSLSLLIALHGCVPFTSRTLGNESVAGLIQSVLRHKNLEMISRTALSSLDMKERTIVSALLMNVAFWSARLDGDDKLARNLLDIISGAAFEDQKRLLLCQLGSTGLYGSDNSGTRLEQIVSAVQFGDSLKPFVCSSTAENRYEIALLCMLTASKYESSDVVRSVSHALYALHCLKFSDLIKSGGEGWCSHIGTEGLLSLLHSDRVPLHSIVPTIPPLQKHYIALESIRLAAAGYERIGYVPGASWLLHRGLTYIDVVGKEHESISVRLARFRAMFRSRLKTIHLSSPTAIPDPHLDTLLFADANESDSLRDVSYAVEERLNVLRSIVINQHTLHSRGDLSHIERLEQVRLNARTHRLSQATCRSDCKTGKIVFEVSDEDDLVLALVLDGDTVLREPVCGNVTEVATALLTEQYELLAKNKELIESAQDSKQFWSERRDLDTAMGELIAKMKKHLLSESVVKRVVDLVANIDNKPIVLLSLPDILLGLPMEVLLDDFCCVRSVRMNPHGRAVPLQTSEDLRCSYVVNPNGDCLTTQSTILPILTDHNWTGRSGSPTLNDKEFANLLKTSDIFLFSGHGGGEKHWSGSSVQRLFPTSHGIALLMGCSSAKPYGDYESCFATPFHYLIGGFRAVVGTLWDVLGRELDRMTSHMIHSITSANPRELVHILQEAKRLAKLSNLSSASVVVYVDESLFPN